MQIRPLIWQYVGTENCLWLGLADGLLNHISFFITAIPDQADAYLVRTDINGIPNEKCIGLETAKKRAQDLLNGYAVSLIII